MALEETNNLLSSALEMIRFSFKPPVENISVIPATATSIPLTLGQNLESTKNSDSPQQTMAHLNITFLLLEEKLANLNGSVFLFHAPQIDQTKLTFGALQEPTKPSEFTQFAPKTLLSITGTPTARARIHSRGTQTSQGNSSSSVPLQH